jgi:hypothetical protein
MVPPIKTNSTLQSHSYIRLWILHCTTVRQEGAAVGVLEVAAASLMLAAPPWGCLIASVYPMSTT